LASSRPIGVSVRLRCQGFEALVQTPRKVFCATVVQRNAQNSCQRLFNMLKMRDFYVGTVDA
jgi:hypothetical protein